MLIHRFVHRVYARLLRHSLSQTSLIGLRILDRFRFPEYRVPRIDLKKLGLQKELIEKEVFLAFDSSTVPRFLLENPFRNQDFSRLKIAILINENENKLLIDVFQELRKSAIDVGHECEIFNFSSKFREASRVQAGAINPNLELLDFNPDLVFIEAHNYPNDVVLSNGIELGNLKTRLGFKLFVVAIDLWRHFDVNFIDLWERHYDFLVHLDNESIREFGIKHEFWWPYFSHPLTPKEVSKDAKLVRFSGNLKFPDRRHFLYTCSSISKKLKIPFLIEGLQYTSSEWRPRSDYLKDLANSLACLNLTVKKKDFSLITFRTLDALVAGCALIQQESEHSRPLRDFLVPYKHYLPFTDITELQALFLLIKEKPDLIRQIALSGQQFYAEQYSNRYLWSLISAKINN